MTTDQVTLTSVAMKCFEKLVMAHINNIIPETLDPLQFAYHPNRSTDNAISIALHTSLSHLDKRNTYVRILFKSNFICHIHMDSRCLCECSEMLVLLAPNMQ